MSEFDINIERATFSVVHSQLSKNIAVLSKCAEALQRNLTKASKDFDSSNFARASNIVGSIQLKLNEILHAIDMLKRYMDELSIHTDDYLMSAFRG